MCGILFTKNTENNQETFIRALGLQSHRGPDVPINTLFLENISLGHNRLSIIDVESRANQPFYSADKSHAIVFNGEIYNYLELAKQFNIQMRTTSDTELLIELFKMKGPEFLNFLNGIFAFVIIDLITGEFFAARDRLGVKPLYMHNSGNKWVFASEIASVLELSGITKIDEFSLRQYRKLRAFFNGRTLYSGISMFPAGYYSLNGKMVQYWNFPVGHQAPPTDEEVDHLIRSSIAYRLIADVPVGSYLSGGLDSTIVAGLSGRPHTWTIGFQDENEFEWARLAADKFKSVHHEVLITAEEFIELGKFMIRKRKEPLSVPNEILLYKMTLEVKKFNTVVLSGEGADELFFGYDRIFKWAENSKWDIAEFSKYYSYGSVEDLEVVEDAISPFLKYGNAIDIVAAFFQISHLHGLLRRLDNSTMLCGVEAREPFVDYRLIERMAGVPFNYRMENGVVKAPLKRIFKDLVPSEIIDRKKVGFPVKLEQVLPDTIKGDTPFDKWFEFNLMNLGINF